MGYLVITNRNMIGSINVPTSFGAMNSFLSPNYILPDYFVGYINENTGELCTDLTGIDVPSITYTPPGGKPLLSNTTIELELNGYVYNIKILLNNNTSTNNRTANITLPDTNILKYTGTLTINQPGTSSSSGSITVKYQLRFYDTLKLSNNITPIWALFGPLPDIIKTITGYTYFIYCNGGWFGSNNNTTSTTSVPSSCFYSAGSASVVKTLTENEYNTLISAGYDSKQSITATYKYAIDTTGNGGAGTWQELGNGESFTGMLQVVAY